MFVQFKIGNFLSFKDTVTFSMVGYTSVKESDNDNTLNNVFYDPTEKNKLLKSAVIYGANNSGKSNLLSAMNFYRKFILTSSNEKQATDEISIIKFLLSTETENEPSFFEMIFFIGDIRYRYGFEADREKIYSEWLFSLKNEFSAKEIKLFTREFQVIKTNRLFFKEGKGIEDKTRPNALFLSTVAQLNGTIATMILTWFKTNLNTISGLDDNTTSYTISKFQEDDNFREIIIEFFKSIQIGFDDIEIEEKEADINTILNSVSNGRVIDSNLNIDVNKIEKLVENTRQVSIETSHKKYNQSGDFIQHTKLPFQLQSKGTAKLFGLLGPIIDTIQKGKILVVDELDSRLHTLLTMELIKFFHSKMNKKAQLIFVSHDTNILRKEIFHRDQIWFAEKNTVGATDLYSLVEYKINQATVRNDASFEKDYLLGKYGAIPFLGDIQKFVIDYLYEQEK